MISYGELTIHSPAGTCPVPLRAVDDEAVLLWADKVREHYEGRGQRITPRGLLYHSRDFFAYGTPEYRRVRDLLLVEESDRSPWRTPH